MAYHFLIIHWTTVAIAEAASWGQWSAKEHIMRAAETRNGAGDSESGTRLRAAKPPIYIRVA